jgi:uncharacterized protein (TIGR02246 family)
MDRLDALEMQVACTDVVNRYAQAVNDQDVETFVSMFAPDGVWARPGMVMQGRDEIRAFISKMFVPGRPVRHLNGGVVIDPVGPDAARVRSITCVFDTDQFVDGKALMKSPAYLAEYDDLIRKIEGRWLIQKRDTSVVFVSANARPIPGIKPMS